MDEDGPGNDYVKGRDDDENHYHNLMVMALTSMTGNENKKHDTQIEINTNFK